MVVANAEVREKAKAAGVALWRIGAELGVCEMTLIRWLRTPLSAEKERRILEIIEKMSQEEAGM